MNPNIIPEGGADQAVPSSSGRKTKKSKKNLSPEEKAKIIEEEKDTLLTNVYAGNPEGTKEKVASILSKNIKSRNSDIELAWAYWKEYNRDQFDGQTLTKGTFLQLPKISSLCRSRAKIQNEYNLFLADTEVRQYRGKLEDEFKENAIEDRAPAVKSLFVYIDETGKTQNFLSLGSLWLPTFSGYYKTQEIIDWKKYSGIDYEFHFKDLRAHKLEEYKSFVDKFLNLHPEASFKSIIIRKQGIRDVDAAIKDLTYYLLRDGVNHENSTNRAPLPRNLVVTIDNENEANDALKLADVKDKLTAQRIEGLTLGDFTAADSKSNEYLQIVDLFTGAINRKLHSENGESPKDVLAEFILDRLGLRLDEYINDEIDADNIKMFSFLRS